MRILITGNMGYIGPTLVRQVRGSHPEAEIIGVDMGYFANCLSNSMVFPECSVDVQHFKDIRYLPESLFKGVDAVVHLAAMSNDPMGSMFEKVTFQVNYDASVSLANAAKKAGVKTFVYASSCSMYGAADDSPRTEKSALNPLTVYAKSKISTEKELARLTSDNFRCTSLRFSTACGMSERLRMDLVLNDFVACAVTSKRITVLSDGTPWRPLVHIKDMVLAMDWAMMRGIEKDGDKFLAVNVGSDEWNYQVKDLAEAVAEIIPGTDVSINTNAPPDKRSYRVSFELFRKLAPADYQPKSNLSDTIIKLKEGLEAMNFMDENFRESDFIRLKVLRKLIDNGRLDKNLRWKERSGNDFHGNAA